MVQIYDNKTRGVPYPFLGSLNDKNELGGNFMNTSWFKYDWSPKNFTSSSIMVDTGIVGMDRIQVFVRSIHMIGNRKISPPVVASWYNTWDGPYSGFCVGGLH